MSPELIGSLLGEALELPRIAPKGTDELVSPAGRYTGISTTGPESLRHFKRTYKQALKRQIASGLYDPKRPVVVPMRLPLQTSTGAVSMAPLVLIDLDTTAGITGRSYLFAIGRPHLRPIVALVEAMAASLALSISLPAALVRKLVQPLFRGADVDHLEQLEGSLPGLLFAHAHVVPQHFGDLGADAEQRVEGCHRVLEDHGDLLAPHLFEPGPTVRTEE